jgi:glycosyltransferase involved in cell wall biosynthesis
MINKENDTSKPLSVAIITKDEEERLSVCLESLGFADEVLVVDSGSTDGTVRVAKSFGARVLVEKWRGFSAQKQFAVDHCLHEWVLILDADERVPEETARAIRQELTAKESTISAYSLRRKNFLHGRWIRHCGWWPDRVERLVDRRRGHFDGRPVHERWVTEGCVQELEAFIENFSFSNYSQLVAKMERYSNLASRELFEKNARANPFTPISHGLWMFIKTYVLELGVLDGFDGFVIALMNAGGSFLKYAKLKEMLKDGTNDI